MNTKILASIAAFALIVSIVGTSFTHSAYAVDADTNKTDSKSTLDKNITDMTTKLADRKAAMDKRMDAKKAKIESKKTAMDKRMDAKKAKIESKIAQKATKEETPAKSQTAVTTAPLNAVTIVMAKGTASNPKCDDQCFVPNKVSVTVGGKVTWKNEDSAGHFATSADGKTFDTGMVNAGASSAVVTMNTAGTYDYSCMVHPWMKGSITVS